MTRASRFRRVLGCGVCSLLAQLACSSARTNDAQILAEAQAISECTAENTQHVTSVRDFVAGMTHSWVYQSLPLDALNAALAATRALDRGDMPSALAQARSIGFDVVGLKTAKQCYWLLSPTDSAPVGQASLVYSPGWKRDLVIEAPHVPEDHNTDLEAAILFEGLGAKAMIIAGAHRCAVTETSGCRATKQCNNSGIPVQSDPAHSIFNAVNAMHLAFRQSTSTVLQLHTNFHPELNGDAMVSNGTRYAIVGTPADALFQALSGPDIDARSCNDPDAPADASAFCGETSTQSLSSNGASDACTGRASSAGGAARHRFVHLEQSNDRLSYVDDWAARVKAALEVAIPAEPE